MAAFAGRGLPEVIDISENWGEKVRKGEEGGKTKKISIVAKKVFNDFYSEPKNVKTGVFYSQRYKKRYVLIRNKEFP